MRRGGPWSASVWEARAELRLAEGEPGQALAFLREAAEGIAKAGRPVDERRCRTGAEAIARAPSRPSSGQACHQSCWPHTTWGSRLGFSLARARADPSEVSTRTQSPAAMPRARVVSGLSSTWGPETATPSPGLRPRRPALGISRGSCGAGAPRQTLLIGPNNIDGDLQRRCRSSILQPVCGVPILRPSHSRPIVRSDSISMVSDRSLQYVDDAWSVLVVVNRAEDGSRLEAEHAHSKLTPCHLLDFRAQVNRCKHLRGDTFRVRRRSFVAQRPHLSVLPRISPTYRLRRKISTICR